MEPRNFSVLSLQTPHNFPPVILRAPDEVRGLDSGGLYRRCPKNLNVKCCAQFTTAYEKMPKIKGKNRKCRPLPRQSRFRLLQSCLSEMKASDKPTAKSFRVRLMSPLGLSSQ